MLRGVPAWPGDSLGAGGAAMNGTAGSAGGATGVTRPGTEWDVELMNSPSVTELELAPLSTPVSGW